MRDDVLNNTLYLILNNYNSLRYYMQFTNKISKNRFFFGIILNTSFVLVELIYGFSANSVALIADAVHNASDVLGLGMVWFSNYVAKYQATRKFTYGFKNLTIFAAFINAIILFLAIGNVMWESIMRLSTLQPVIPTIVIWVALLGALVNGVTALLFIHDKNTDINIRGIFLNMALDTILSIVVVIGGILILWKNWVLVDPILGILIAVTILYSFWALFKESINLILQAVPENIDLHELILDINNFAAVKSYHDLHVWALSTTEAALSVHIIIASDNFNPELACKLSKLFRDKYNIHHSTIQLEVAGMDNENLPGCAIC